MNLYTIDKIILDALNEDVTSEDLTTEAIIPNDSVSEAKLIAKQDGVIAGIFVFKRVFELLGSVEVETLFNDGAAVKYGDVICRLNGNTKNMLIGERTALNFIQRMSGISTLTSEFVKRIEGTKAVLLDTRKTTPNLRILEKYATRIGGAVNHRFNLSDGILIKDNHIKAAGSITKAVELVRKRYSNLKRIEVETESLDMVKEALDCKADIIMLDNMNLELIKQSVELINGRALIEVSGNVNLDTVSDIAKTGVDFISTGAITHSYKSMDLSLRIM
ncbi:Nicotinate-nucleotide pyrophosphorylase [carboxylating] [Caloramator mitchellensis]|uniref:Probable nicotinate-nucleotide pyrophosphorylase [carboxylating] n=1 Tax=Caloramator mitchellensis TaxID=908809 RepID=A0A0R3JZB3_CALMK|nr:carboxylating nicotinate-nucleotide diphosphorylase [Caloramator mitchellensis]KRQ87629.1 Nicotinate-nucleotide pyrophosphorylase [carboxylating] [Caloramator mitchellensis]